jgi:uncharacterized protein (DUF924 family)
MDEAKEVREFWFAQGSEQWFGPVLDDEIRTRFGALTERAAAGLLDHWADSPRRRLSLIILLDQFPRNLYRGSEKAFAQDDRALALTLTGMQSGADAALGPVERIFFLMPLQHAESLQAQEESVAAYRRLLDDAPADDIDLFTQSLESAEAHRAVIERFGRFPHRNTALGRESTAEEAAFIAETPDF